MTGVSKDSEQAVTLAFKSSVRVERDNVQVHPQLLFLFSVPDKRQVSGQ